MRYSLFSPPRVGSYQTYSLNLSRVLRCHVLRCSTAGGRWLSPKSRILIVDASTESREILRTLLQRKGAETLEASGARRASQIVRERQPDLILYDAESEKLLSAKAREDAGALDDLGRTTTRSDIPIVVLGTTKRRASPFPTGQFVSKPYHYAPLIRRIEELLAGRAE